MCDTSFFYVAVLSLPNRGIPLTRLFVSYVKLHLFTFYYSDLCYLVLSFRHNSVSLRYVTSPFTKPLKTYYYDLRSSSLNKRSTRYPNTLRVLCLV